MSPIATPTVTARIFGTDVRLSPAESQYLHRYLRYLAGASATPPSRWSGVSPRRAPIVRGYAEALFDTIQAAPRRN